MILVLLKVRMMMVMVLKLVRMVSAMMVGLVLKIDEMLEIVERLLVLLEKMMVYYLWVIYHKVHKIIL